MFAYAAIMTGTSYDFLTNDFFLDSESDKLIPSLYSKSISVNYLEFMFFMFLLAVERCFSVYLILDLYVLI